jgi:hypothetical protein
MSLADTLHQMIDLLPWREESHQLSAHESVEAHFATPPDSPSENDDTDDVNNLPFAVFDNPPPASFGQPHA